MNRFRGCIALLLVYAYVEFGHSDEGPIPEPYTIIHNAVQACGGKEVLAKLLSYRLRTKGLIYVGERTAPINATLLYRSDPISCKLTSEIRSPDGLIKETSVFNGKTVWLNRNGTTREGNETEQFEARGSANDIYFSCLFPLLDKKRFTLSSLPVIKIKGNDAVGVRMSSRDHHDICFYFDRKTWLLVKKEYKGFSKPQEDKLYEEYYEDFKKLEGGITHYTKKTVFINGKKRVELELVDFKPMSEIKDTEFAKP